MIGWPPRRPVSTGRRIAGGLAALVTALAAALAIVVGFSATATTTTSKQPAVPPAGRPQRAAVASPSAPSHPGFTYHRPATIPTPNTPVQQRVDQSFEKGFSSPGNRRAYAAVAGFDQPGPSVGGGWPALPVANSPEQWAQQFTSGLLDITFAHQSRAALAGWLVAASAPDSMPGVPANAAPKMAAASVLDASATGGNSPIPPAAVWAMDAKAHVAWQVSNLDVQVEPQWQSMIDAGWQPADVRAVVEDVTGTLTVTGGRHPSTSSFQLVLLLGSATWHGGYGTAITEKT